MTGEEKVKILKRAARRIHKGMKRGGFQSTPKGGRGYKRHPKHRNGEKEN